MQFSALWWIESIVQCNLPHRFLCCCFYRLPNYAIVKISALSTRGEGCEMPKCALQMTLKIDHSHTSMHTTSQDHLIASLDFDRTTWKCTQNIPRLECRYDSIASYTIPLLWLQRIEREEMLERCRERFVGELHIDETDLNKWQPNTHWTTDNFPSMIHSRWELTCGIVTNGMEFDISVLTLPIAIDSIYQINS